MQIRFLVVLLAFIVKTTWGQSNEININHANTFISLARENGNDEYYLDRAIHYLNLCKPNSKTNPDLSKQTNSLRKEIEIAKATSENNLNYQIEFYQLLQLTQFITALPMIQLSMHLAMHLKNYYMYQIQRWATRMLQH